MLTQILTHTPLFVWALLALLVFRGIMATQARDVEPRKLFIIPAVMLALALQDLATRWGCSAVALAAWAAGVLAMALPLVLFSRTRIVAAVKPGTLRLRGSWAPLAVMLAVFVTKYTAIIATILHPQLRQSTLFVAALCAAGGLSNGYFLGSLARDLKAALALRGAAPAAEPALAA
jgi:uncharacterized membrane protein